MATAIPPEVCARIERLRRIYTVETVAELTGVAPSSIWKLAKRGYKPVQIGQQPRPVPADFTVMANRMSYDQLCVHYHVGGPQLRRWIKSIKREYRSDRVYARLPMPTKEEVEAKLGELGVRGAQDYFGVSNCTFVTWRNELGIPLEQHATRKDRAALRAKRLAVAANLQERLAA